MAKTDNKYFTKVNDPVSDYLESKKELMRMRFAKALGDTSLDLSKFRKVRKFSAICMSLKRNKRGN